MFTIKHSVKLFSKLVHYAFHEGWLGILLVIATIVFHLCKRQIQLVPNIHHRIHKLLLHQRDMEGCGGNPKFLLSTGNGWIVDVLHVDAVLVHQHTRGLGTAFWITNLYQQIWFGRGERERGRGRGKEGGERGGEGDNVCVGTATARQQC